MSDQTRFTTMRSLMAGLAKAMNLVNSATERHHEQTAYLAMFVAREMGMPEEDVVLALYSALLHDIGSIVSEEPQSIVEIEGNAREISQIGASMLSELDGFEDIAAVISYSQCSWRETVACAIEEGATCERLGRIASVVHLADVVSLALTMGDESRESMGGVLNQSKDIIEMAKNCSGTMFCPEAVDAFVDVASQEYVWMDLAHNPYFLMYFTGDIAEVSLEQAVQLTRFMSHLIDYRSPFTAMHSAGVAASARELAVLAGMTDEDVMEMEIAGNLHDVGKLAVPRSILEKPGRLTDDEFNTVKQHPYYTSLVLLDLEGFDGIRKWACNHHEKLNGRGYPFHFSASELGTGDRIMAVADIFSAITEERPYRAGMTREQVAKVLQEDVSNHAICGDLVALLLDNYERVDNARDEASHIAGKRYFDSLGKR